MQKKLLSVFLSVFLSACAVGPDYKQAPSIEVGEHYKAASLRDWVSSPHDDLSREDWWLRFNDPTLNQLMNELNNHNFQLAQAMANYEAAAASVKSARSGFFPTLGIDADVTRSGGKNQSVSDAYQGNATVSWEIDLWGKIRRQLQASQAGLQASAADMANVRLSLQGQLAKAYFALRMSDEQARLQQQMVQSYTQAVNMNQNRYEQGVAARADVVSALTQLENARAQAIALESTRQQYESAIAVLLGRAPSQLNMAPQAVVLHIPNIPTVLPSALLLRRPDIYAAERAVAQANEEIGMAAAAWLPSLNLSASVGAQASSWSDWISAPLNFWSLGPKLAMTIFDGGARSAAVASSQAAYRAKVAAYRQTVLNALKEVEDNMTATSVLERQYAVQQRALAAARESLQITRNQYQAGLVNYLNVIQVENTAYNTEISTLQLMNQRLNTAIDLIMALGGGWSATTLQNQ